MSPGQWVEVSYNRSAKEHKSIYLSTLFSLHASSCNSSQCLFLLLGEIRLSICITCYSRGAPMLHHICPPQSKFLLDVPC